MTRAAELTALLADGTLSEAEGRELDALLAADPEALAEHLDLLDLEGALRGGRTGFDLSGSTLDRVRAVLADRTSAGVMAEIAALPSPPWAPRPPARRRRHTAVLAVAAACAAALMVGLWLGRPPAGAGPGGDPGGNPIPASDPANALARVTVVTGAVEVLTPAGETLAPAPGRALTPGETLRTVGDDAQAVVEFPDRTRVELQPDTTVRLTPAEHGGPPGGQLFLATGQMTTTVPDAPDVRPVVVRMPAADVLTRGGTFVVSSASPESARVESRKGKVQVVRADAPAPVTVLAGAAAVIRPGLARVDLEASLRADLTPRRVLPLPGVRELTFSPDGREVWAVTARQFTRWTVDGGTADLPLAPKRADGPVAFAPDRSALVVARGGPEGLLVLRGLPAGAGRPKWKGVAPLPDARLVTAGPGAGWVAVASPKPRPHLLAVWDGATGGERFPPVTFAEAVTCLAGPPDGSAVAVGLADVGRGGHTRVVGFDPATGARRFVLPTQRKGLTALAFSPDGRLLAAGTAGQVQVWDAAARELLRTVTGFERAVTTLEFSPDGRRIAAGTPDGRVWVWDARSGRPVLVIEAGTRPVRAVAFNPDGRSLAVATADPGAGVGLWDLPPEHPGDAVPDA